MSGKGALKSGKRGGKSLRKKKRVDYRLMHSGKAHENESSSAVETSSEIDESPWRAPVLGNTASAAPPVSPVVPHEWLVEDDDEKDYDEQMAEISAEMSRLEEEEKKLAKREKLEAMKRELASKRQKVSDLKDAQMHSLKKDLKASRSSAYAEDIRKVTIICDSIPKNVNGIDGCRVQPFPGDTIAQLANRLIPRQGRAREAVLDNFEYVIFHVGTNDIDNRASYQAILSDFGNLIAICRKQKPAIKIIISAIIPRPRDHSDTDSMIRRVGELTDGQACVCDMALEDGRVDNFRVEIRPNDGYYEGGVFKFRIQIPSDYEWNEPPKVFCETDIYHPNINTREGGSSIVCLNLLHYGTWDRKFGLEGVVLGLVYLLHHPNLASPLYVVETWDKETFEKNVAKYMRGESVAGRKFSAEFLKKLDDPKKTKSRRDSKPDEQAGGNDTASNSAAVDSNDEKLERLLKALEELGVTEETVPQDEPYEDFIDDIRAQITELERSESVESIDSAGSGVVFDERGNDRWSYHYGRDNSYDSTVCGE